ncbi:MAG: threonine aldolase family protein, partial [Leadbetterella sp.]
MDKLLDFRSDTVTRPSMEMLDRMMQAPVGDDVFGDDPSVEKLESMAADMFGMEASLFCTSGTQTNQLAFMAQTTPGDEVICSDYAHVYQYEGGGIATNAGVAVQAIPCDRGLLTADLVQK